MTVAQNEIDTARCLPLGSHLRNTSAWQAESASACNLRAALLPVNSLQRRTAEPHRNLIGAGLCTGFAYFIRVANVASSNADGIGMGAAVRYSGDQTAIAEDVDVGRRRPSPREIHRVHSTHPVP